MSETNTGKIVRYEIDFDHAPSPTGEQQVQLQRLATMTDDQIDLSDIPECDFSKAKRMGSLAAWLDGQQRKDIDLAVSSGVAGTAAPEAAAESVRVSADVIEFFRGEGDVPSRIDTVLRDYIAQHRKSG